jgi:putative glutamine amidotransferase
VTVPLVALTTSSVAEGGRHQQPQILLYSAYIRALEEAGLAPVLLTPSHSARSVRALMDRCAGVVLSGGEDVDPRRYGEAPHPALGEVAPERDEMEMTALAVATRDGIPVLAICRGAQVLNVALGGTLDQHITDQPHVVGHGIPGRDDGSQIHAVNVTAGSRLAEALGATRVDVSSHHHQAIEGLGAGLRVTGRADDDVVEGVELDGDAWIVAAQWHPEDTSLTDPHQRSLFETFVQHAATHQRS